MAHHLPGTVCEPLVFSTLGACTPATLRRLHGVVLRRVHRRSSDPTHPREACKLTGRPCSTLYSIDSSHIRSAALASLSSKGVPQAQQEYGH